MPSRNTEVLQQIIETLDDLLTSRPHALSRLEIFFKDSLLLVAGNESEVARHAEKLRLAVIENECGPVLDYIHEHRLARITIDPVEEAINALYPDRFVEPSAAWMPECVPTPIFPTCSKSGGSPSTRCFSHGT